MKRLLLLIAVVTATLAALAQRNVTGKVIEAETNEPLAMTTVKLLKTDSTMAKGGLTATNGSFSIAAPADGKYILQVTCIGFKTYHKNITISGGKNMPLGTISMEPDAIMLKGATVTGRALKVTTREDTFVYNAAAYRTPEGSVVEELIKRLPGAKIDDDGNITINGKEVKKILVDGKEFMVGDTKTALKNLPTSIIEKVKSYDEKSDLARVSGIDDGEEQTVLDFGIKKGMNKGLLSNADLSYGTKDRYAARLMAMRFTDKLRLMGFGSANNTNDRGFGGRGGRFGGGRRGLQSSKMLGLNFNYEEKDKLRLDGSVRWNHGDGDTRTKNSTENFVSTEGSFSNSLNQSYSRSDSWNAQMRFEWHPDTMTTIMFRPTFSYSTSDGISLSESATFNEDPYLYVSDPLAAASIEQMAADSMAVNSRRNSSITYSESKSFGGMLMFNRRLNNEGRNVTLRLRGNFGDSESKSLSTNNVHLYKTKNMLGQDSTYQTNRYNLTPQKNWDYSIRATYSEPIFKATFLQFSYEFQYKYTKSDRSTFDFSNLGENFFVGLSPVYRGWDDYLNRLENPYTTYLDEDLSRFSEYKNYIHDIEVMMRIIRPTYNLNFGVTVMPQKTNFVQRYQGVTTDTTRTVTNISPTLDFRWKISKVSQLRVRYRGTTSQPSMSDLLDITDDSDPLNISMGNPGLKPSFTNTLNMFYNNYIENHYKTLMANFRFQTTSNSISNMVRYDPETGGRTTRPENINGNWSTRGQFLFNSAIDSAGLFNVSTNTEIRYTNSVGYVSIDNQDSQKNTTRSTSFEEELTAGFRNDWFEFELNGSVEYEHSRNKLQPNSNLDTWEFAYGFNSNVRLPWGTEVAFDLNMNSRRGYSDESLNTNELIWNAQVSQSFLKGKNLIVMLQFYDLLHQQSNFSRTINAMQRSDTEYNAITSFGMLHVIYRLNLFGSKEARQNMQPRGPRDRGMGPRGPRGGGFGRPGRF